jgi:hypothetical protein
VARGSRDLRDVVSSDIENAKIIWPLQASSTPELLAGTWKHAPRSDVFFIVYTMVLRGDCAAPAHNAPAYAMASPNVQLKSGLQSGESASNTRMRVLAGFP